MKRQGEEESEAETEKHDENKGLTLSVWIKNRFLKRCEQPTAAGEFMLCRLELWLHKQSKRDTKLLQVQNQRLQERGGLKL